jgi:hypothetical protein
MKLALLHEDGTVISEFPQELDHLSDLEFRQHFLDAHVGCWLADTVETFRATEPEVRMGRRPKVMFR